MVKPWRFPTVLDATIHAFLGVQVPKHMKPLFLVRMGFSPTVVGKEDNGKVPVQVFRTRKRVSFFDVGLPAAVLFHNGCSVCMGVANPEQTFSDLFWKLCFAVIQGVFNCFSAIFTFHSIQNSFHFWLFAFSTCFCSPLHPACFLTSCFFQIKISCEQTTSPVSSRCPVDSYPSDAGGHWW